MLTFNCQFHCNWGSNGDYDGRFYLGDFNPYSKNLNEFEHAIFNLYPGVDFFSDILGPDELTSSPGKFLVNNFFDCTSESWSYSSNITSVYGNTGWIAVKATSSGTGWLQATLTKDGTTYTTPKKYITCNP